MAFKRTRRSSKRTYRKRRPMRRYRRRSFKRSLKKYQFGGFPMTKRVHLRYNETISINSNANINGYVFRANSIYDPNSTGVGHQPMGHDIWANIYNHYVVVGAKITARFLNTGTDNIPVCLGVLLDDDGGAITSETVNTIMERGVSKWKLSFNNYGVQFGQVPTITNRFSAKKFFNIKDVKDNDSVGAAMGANPSDLAYFIVWQGPMDGSADPAATNVNVTIDYIVDFSEPKDQTAN